MDIQRSYPIVLDLKIEERQVLELIEKQVPELMKVAMVVTGRSRPTVSSYLNNLIKRKFVESEGNTKAKTYKLGKNRAYFNEYPLGNMVGSASNSEVRARQITEHLVWEDYEYVFETLPPNIYEICFYGFTEMINNAIDHSCGKKLRVIASLVDGIVDLMIHDDGEGIFKRIARLCELESEKESILELSKGKLTTDPENHSGEGIYFTSRVFDRFSIYSSGHLFDHDKSREDDYLLEHNNDVGGTIVEMQISTNSKTSLEDVFNQFAPADEFSFSKTIVPVRLAIKGRENLVSRSQAKRVLARLEQFKTIILDFDDVDTIGQAFADEVFRVFVRKHQELKIIPINTNETIDKWIARAQGSTI